jgi:NADPH:quinone reductase-like Zn-dependent oxidoreductase
MSKLVRLHHFGGREVLRTEELDVSQPDAGRVLVSVRAASAPGNEDSGAASKAF